MLDPQRLRVFRSVVVTGSMQAAADQLRMSSSAVSQHVAALQRETGLILLERAGRGVRPTPAGTRIAAASGDALRSLNRLGALVKDLREGRTGHLTIGHFASAGLAWMPGIVRRLRAEFPDLMVELVLTDIPVDQSATAGPATQPDIDIRIALEGEPAPAGFTRLPLVEDPFLMAVHRSHRLARRRTAPLSEFRDDDYVANDFVNQPYHEVQARAYVAAGFTPRYIVQAADHLSALAFVDEGIGVTMLPVLATADLPPRVRVVALTDPVPVRDIYALVRDAIAMTPAATRVVELLRQQTT